MDEFSMAIRWLPVASAPQTGEDFLTLSPGISIDRARFDLNSEDFWKDCCGWDTVTHWAELPEILVGK